VSFADQTDRLVRERRARLAAERLLEQKKRELYAANQQLSLHARALGDQLHAERRGHEQARNETRALQEAASLTMQRLGQATAAARLADQRLWTAIETFQNGFAIFDADLRLVLRNGSYLAGLRDAEGLGPGSTYEEVLDQVIASALLDLDGMDAADWRHMMLGRVLAPEIAPMVVRFTDGRHFRLVDRRTAEGDLVSLIIDITETVRREAELEEARARAEAATRAKSAFLANMTHELRTPMNGVVGMAELLAEGTLDDEQRLYVDTIRSSGAALLTIINEVLDYSKAEAARLQLFPEPFDLERTAQEVLILLQPLAAEKGLALRLDFDPVLPARLVADPGRMRQILTNLAGNAVKFTLSGSVTIRVCGLARGEGDWALTITVEDTGIGIAREHAEVIFGEFNQVQSAANRAFDGTGLGLAITRQLVELMGGRVWVDSEPGKGSIFGVDVTLPPADDSAFAPLSPGYEVAVAGLDAGLAAQFGRQLDALGARARVQDAPGAVASALRPPQAVIFDPPPDATLAAAWLETFAMHWPGVPVLCLSDGSERLPPDSAGTRVHLRKPAIRADLLRALSGPPVTVPLSDPTAPAPDPSAATGPRQMRVLAAEDNRTNQLVFRKMVKDFDIDLAIASDGAEAVEMWRSFRPDLIFMDISMPVMDGRDATRAIRSEEAALGRPRVPIVALTAHAMNGDGEDILAAGLDHYLTKPLRKTELAERILASRPEEARPPLPASEETGEGAQPAN
jgi:hypothetical protein